MPGSADWYKDKIDEHTTALARLKKSLYTIAVFRLFSFVVFCWSVYHLLSVQNAFTIVLALVLFVLFLCLVKYSGQLTIQKKLQQNLLYINENEAGILRGEKNKFSKGEAFQSGESYFLDLDIFGDGSLFQLLNRATTPYGNEAVAHLLQQPLLVGQDIILQQEALQQLAPQFKHRQAITAAAMGKENTEEDNGGLYKWLTEAPKIITNKWLNSARYVLPVINLAAMLVSLYIDQYFLVSLSVLLSWMHVGYVAGYVSRQTALLGKKQESLELNAAVLRQFNNVDAGSSVVLRNLQQHTHTADAELSRLAQLVNLADQRLNVLVNILLNSFLVYDLHTMASLEKWKAKNAGQLSYWLQAVGQIEQLVSFSTYVFNHPENCFPTLSSDIVEIAGEAVYHPLIPMQENVRNNINIGQTAKLMLITGSNMSGKTTYLRTTGINVLMAQCGLPVCAFRFRFSPMRIYSSIRISDSLQEHTSFFMAELKRLQYIKQQVEEGAPALVLIDEILRGTNSVDKYHGSEQFVLQLIRFNCLTLFATHDLKLSELEQQYPGAIENYCFESTIEQDELSFDYTILRGVARNKNASFLMKKMNII